VHRLTERAPRNKVVVAIASKLARVAWAVLSDGKDYKHQPLQMTAAWHELEAKRQTCFGQHR